MVTPEFNIVHLRCAQGTTLWICNDTRLFRLQAYVLDDETSVDLIISVHWDVLLRHLKAVRKVRIIFIFYFRNTRSF